MIMRKNEEHMFEIVFYFQPNTLHNPTYLLCYCTRPLTKRSLTTQDGAWGVRGAGCVSIKDGVMTAGEF